MNRTLSPLWSQVVPLMFVALLAGVFWYWPEVSHWLTHAWPQPPAAQWTARADTLCDRPGWLVRGAGDDSYNGVYVEAGVYEGRPCYLYRSSLGPRYLLYEGNACWSLNDALESCGKYVGSLDAPDLPAGPWVTGGYGLAPAPTLRRHDPLPPEPALPGAEPRPRPHPDHPPTTPVTGVVLAGETPVEGVRIWLYRETLDAPPLTCVVTDATGRYELALTPGTWHVRAHKPGYRLTPDSHQVVTR